jgi:hypothetical protein
MRRIAKKEITTLDIQVHKICKAFIKLSVGKSVQVVFSNGGHIEGVVKKEGRNYYIGVDRLNGKLITNVKGEM